MAEYDRRAGEGKHALVIAVVEWPRAKRVAGAIGASAGRIVDGESEIAFQPGRAIFPPGAIGGQDKASVWHSVVHLQSQLVSKRTAVVEPDPPEQDMPGVSADLRRASMKGVRRIVGDALGQQREPVVPAAGAIGGCVGVKDSHERIGRNDLADIGSAFTRYNAGKHHPAMPEPKVATTR
nr:hypothetical protein [Parerythrobacter jejuensis]